MIDRLQFPYLSKLPRSVIILGPRQVGKSTLIKSLQPDLYINLADEQQLLDFSSDPGLLRSLVRDKNPKTVAIDEIQRLPSLLNTVQFVIDETKIKFYLSGSSVRKLKRGGANLLPGRIVNCNVGPVVLKELNYNVDIKQVLKYGSLPEMLTLKDNNLKEDILKSYASNYVKEEIRTEALTKSLESFSRFLIEIVPSVGQFIDYSKLAKRAKISRLLCPQYLEILEDTMIGYRLFPDKELLEVADLVKHPKFYFFDVGVLNGLNKQFDSNQSQLGPLSEQLAFSQIYHSAQLTRKDFELSTFRTRGGLEIDFLLKLAGHYFAFEIKHSDNIIPEDVSPLNLVRKYLPKAQAYLIHMGAKERHVDGIWCLPLQRALKDLGL